MKRKLKSDIILGLFLLSILIFAGCGKVIEEKLIREEHPVITGENVKKITVWEGDAKRYEFAYVPDDFKGEYAYWNNTEPYHSLVTINTEVLYDRLFAILQSLEFNEGIEYSNEENKVNGLAAPDTKIEIAYYEEGEETKTANKEAILLIGKKSESGYYPVKIEGYKTVYEIPSEDIEIIISANPFDYLLKIGCLVDLDTVKQVNLMFDNKTTAMQIKRNGQETQYRIQSKEASKEAFTELYQNIMGIPIQCEIPEGTQGKEGEPYLKVVYERVSKDAPEMTVEYLPYDDVYAKLRVNGESFFLVAKQDLQKVLDDL